jgi:hypothetical protein
LAPEISGKDRASVCRVTGLIRIVAAATLLWPLPALAADRLDELTLRLRSDPSYKVRTQSAISLGQMRDGRAVPALVAALADQHYGPRAMAALALARIGDRAALPGLRAAAGDTNTLVRSSVERALLALGDDPASERTGIPVGIGTMGNRTGRAIGPLLDRMRRHARVLLQDSAGVRFAAEDYQYTIEGSITALHHRANPRSIEVTCEVSLVLSEHKSGAIVGITTTGATVQQDRRAGRIGSDAVLEQRALERALASAHENLLTHLQGRLARR